MHTIHELSKEFNITPRAMRFWESKGLISFHRDGWTRVADEEIRRRLAAIVILRKAGMPIRNVGAVLERAGHGPQMIESAIKAARAHAFHELEAANKRSEAVSYMASEIAREFLQDAAA